MEADGADDDADLADLAELASGSERALGRLLARHGARLHALAHRYLGDGAEADAVVNEVALRLWRHGAAWRAEGPARFSTWLARIAINAAIDRERARRRFFGLLAPWRREAPDPADDAPGAEAATAARSELAAVRADIRRLPPRQRAAILLAAGQGLEAGEIAEVLGVGRGAAEQLLVRARRRLRDARRARETDGEAPQ